VYLAELANAAHDGQAILDAPTGVRYRAALERGVYTRFHGGSTSALCVDLHFEDPRTVAEKQADIAYELKHPPKNESFASTEEMEKKKGMITYAVAKDGEVMRFDWAESPLLVGWWRDEPNIVDFEKYLCVYQDEPVAGRSFADLLLCPAATMKAVSRMARALPRDLESGHWQNGLRMSLYIVVQ